MSVVCWQCHGQKFKTLPLCVINWFEYLSMLDERRVTQLKMTMNQNYSTITWWRHQMETFSALLALSVGIQRPPVNSTHKGQWRGALMFSFIWARINGCVNNREAGDLRRHRAHYDVIVMTSKKAHKSHVLSSLSFVRLEDSMWICNAQNKTSK